MSPKRIAQPPYPDVVVISGEEYRAKTRTARRYTTALLACVILVLGSVAFTQWKIRDTQTELVQNLIDAGLLPPDSLIDCKTTPEGN